MTSGKEAIIKEIQEHIMDRGGSYGSWYVGISNDAQDRLFNQHGVKKVGDKWIYKRANSSDVAREVEDYFVNTLKTAGGSGGGDHTTDMVYAYRKSANTNP